MVLTPVWCGGLPLSLTSLRNEKAQFKIALRRYLNTHSLYSIDELFMFNDDM